MSRLYNLNLEAPVAVVNDEDLELARKFVGTPLEAQIAALEARLRATETKLDAERTQTRYLLLAVAELKKVEMFSWQRFRAGAADMPQDLYNGVMKYREKLLAEVEKYLVPLAPPAT